MTPAQELRIIIQSLLDWQLRHCKAGFEQDLAMDNIISELDAFEAKLTADQIASL